MGITDKNVVHANLAKLLGTMLGMMKQLLSHNSGGSCRQSSVNLRLASPHSEEALSQIIQTNRQTDRQTHKPSMWL